MLEADTVVGGIARTVERDGWRFDIGGHRFFTKVTPVEARWEEILPGDDFMTRPRLSRIYYRNRFFDYPLKATNALRNLGVVEAGRCVGSYVWARLRPPRDQSTFEGWVAARFGWRLYRIFFKTYTEKVWGVPASVHPGRLGGPAHPQPVLRQGHRRRPCSPGATRPQWPRSSTSSATPSSGPG